VGYAVRAIGSLSYQPWYLGLALLVVMSLPARAQGNTPAPCTSPEFHQFDFWIGRWTVADSTGKQIGSSEVMSVAGGCGLLENWQAVNGGSGKSLNMYERSPGHWTQTWVGSGGAILRLSGGLRNESMVLEDDRVTARGPLKDRITWAPLPDGRVRQTWDVSTDGGATWQKTFDGYYTRR
jgi:hypothetical protein